MLIHNISSMATFTLSNHFSLTTTFTSSSTISIHPQHSLPLPRRSLLAAASATPPPPPPPSSSAPPVLRKRTRYRKRYPGESQGITEEMRFVAMRLRNINGKKISQTVSDADTDDADDVGSTDGDDADAWRPSLEGFLSYLVDSQVVFNAVERIVDDSNDVAYAYFRKTGLERSEGLAKDIEFFRESGVAIPEPSNPGVSYKKYLEALAEKRAPLFLCHFYNIYFSHIAGGQVIGKQVSETLLDGMELEFYKWDGDVPQLLQDVRGNLNMLGQHWSRDEKNKCLREAAKSFRTFVALGPLRAEDERNQHHSVYGNYSLYKLVGGHGTLSSILY